MKILILSGLLFLFTDTGFASSSVGENCAHSNSESLDDGKYNKLLSFLGTKNVNTKRKSKKLRGTPTGKK